MNKFTKYNLIAITLLTIFAIIIKVFIPEMGDTPLKKISFEKNTEKQFEEFTIYDKLDSIYPTFYVSGINVGHFEDMEGLTIYERNTPQRKYVIVMFDSLKESSYPRLLEIFDIIYPNSSNGIDIIYKKLVQEYSEKDFLKTILETDNFDIIFYNENAFIFEYK